MERTKRKGQPNEGARLSRKEEPCLQALGPIPFLRDAWNSYPFVPLVSYLWDSTFPLLLRWLESDLSLFTNLLYEGSRRKAINKKVKTR